ncbi:hypothetical protein MalM25_08310 [Planctomycetes bacterium MalM25]|nr:hypothetical protein MalM25_08310 [Planctomycetes bacterium MalM25]
MSSGFYIRRISVVGTALPEASLSFEDGLSVIVGASETGKTYVVDCLDYVFGARTPPKAIPEAVGYTHIAATLVRRSDDSLHEISRSLATGAVEYRQADGDRVPIKDSASQNDESISSVLLRLTGLEDRKVRTNQRGTTKALSFRDLAKLVVVTETDIVSDSSPLPADSYEQQTGAERVLHLLLTGNDDSDVEEQPDPKHLRGETQGRRELLDSLISRTKASIEKLDAGKDAEEVASRLEKVEGALDGVLAELAMAEESAQSYDAERTEVFQGVRSAEARVRVLDEVSRRFDMLQTQYESDAKRLEAVGIAGRLLLEHTEVRCPVCGAQHEHHSQSHAEQAASPEAVVTAAKAESEKVKRLLTDLQKTRASTDEELRTLDDGLADLRDRLTELDRILATTIEGRIDTYVRQSSELREIRDRLGRCQVLYEELDNYESILAEEKNRKKARRKPSSTLRTVEYEKLGASIRALLDEWGFPGAAEVVYSSEDQDIVIGGRKRADHGKGVRAVLRTAFNLGLARYCIEEGKPHPGIVVVDTPLAVYREPDKEDITLPRMFKEQFYRSLATYSGALQVLVIENEEPPEDIETVANVYRFTAAEHGRSGFIPAKPSADAADSGT